MYSLSLDSGRWLPFLMTAMGGIQQGVERMAKILMPLIYVFGVILITILYPDTGRLRTRVHPDWTPIAGLDFISESTLGRSQLGIYTGSLWTDFLSATGHRYGDHL